MKSGYLRVISMSVALEMILNLCPEHLISSSKWNQSNDELTQFAQQIASLCEETIVEDSTLSIEKSQLDYQESVPYLSLSQIGDIFELQAEDNTLVGASVPLQFNLEDQTICLGNQIISLSEPMIQGVDGLEIPLSALESLGMEIAENTEDYTLNNTFSQARLIVKSKSDIDDFDASLVVEGYQSYHVLQYDHPIDSLYAYHEYSNMEQVEYAEPSMMLQVMGEVEDSSAESYAIEGDHYSWGAKKLSVDSFCDFLTEHHYTEEVVVGVIDTGISYSHDWFQGKIKEGGVDFTKQASAKGEDDHGHGTHVSGTILDLSGDNVKILPVKTMDSSGRGSSEQVFCGIMYALEQGVDVMNLSLGVHARSFLLEDAVKAAYDKNIPICAAAGNDSANAGSYSPANIAEAITVSAIDTTDELAYFSNYGSMVDFTAPGTVITSAYLNNTTKTMRGTSMATPHVSACCALLKTYDKNLTVDEIVAMLAANAIDYGEPGKDPSFGYGLVSMNFIPSYQDFCEMPSFSLAGGDYENTISVTINCKTEDADVYYTTDGRVPSKENGILYQGESIVLSATSVLSAIAIKENAYDSNVRREIYRFDAEEIENPYEIEGNQLVAYYGVKSELIIPNEIDGVVLKTIGAHAFANNTNLKKVILPDSVTEIGDYAFYGCSELEIIHASGVTSVGEKTFYQCKMLSDAGFDTLDAIGTASFYQCEKLETVSVSDNLTEIKERVFFGCESLQNLSAKGVVKVGSYAFYNCEVLEQVAFCESELTELGAYAFSGCSRLYSSFTLPALEKLGTGCFSDCERLRYVTLSDMITVIPNACFQNCSLLNRLTANGVTEIGTYGLALNSYTSAELELNFSALTSVGDYGMQGVFFDNDIIEFSNLQSAGDYALMGIHGNYLLFSNLKTLGIGFLEEAVVEGVSIPNADEIPADVLKNAMIETAELCGKTCDEKAFTSFKGSTLVSEKNSVVWNQIQSENVTKKECVLLPMFDDEISLIPNSAIKLTALAFGDSVSYKWWQGDTLLGTEQTIILTATNQKTEYRLSVSDALGNQEEQIFVILPSDEKMMERNAKQIEKNGAVKYSLTDVTYLNCSGDENIVAVYNGNTLLNIYENPRNVELPSTTEEYQFYVTTKGECYISLGQNAEDLTGKAIATQNILPWFSDNVNETKISLNGTNATVVTSRKENGSTGVLRCYGISDYTGYIDVPYWVAEDLTYGEKTPVSLKYGDILVARFTAVSIGAYTVYSDYTEEQYDALVSGENLYIDPIAKGFDSNFDFLVENDDSGIDKGFSVGFAGEPDATFYVVIRSLNYGKTIDFELALATTINQISNQNIKVTNTCVYGKDILPQIEVKDKSTLLTEGEDYLLTASATSGKLGSNSCYLRGIGRYCGVYKLNYKIVDEDCAEAEQQLIPEKAVEISLENNQVERYLYYVREVSEYTLLQPESVQCRIYLSDETGTLWAEERLITEQKKQFALEPGYYCFDFTSGSTVTGLMTLKRSISIETADLQYKTQLQYDGKTQNPLITLTLDGKELSVNNDYVINYDSNRTEPGHHSFTINGTGDYYGSLSGSFEILMPVEETTLQAEIGENIVEASQAGVWNVYAFVPEVSGSYRFLTNERLRTRLAVSDVEGRLVSHTDESEDTEIFVGVYQVNTVADCEANQTYYIYTRYDVNEQTGTYAFEIQSDYVRMKDLNAIYDKEVSITGDVALPNISFYDGEYRLQENIDYRLMERSDCVSMGSQWLECYGIGKYYGSVILEYEIVANLSAKVEDCEVEVITTDDEIYDDTLRFGNYRVFSFTAETSGVYSFVMIDAWNSMYIHVYDTEYHLLKSNYVVMDGASDVYLEKGKTVYAAVCYEYDTENVESYLEAKYTFMVIPRLYANRESGKSVKVDGIEYILRADGTAVLYNARSYQGTEFTVPAYVENYPVTMIGPYAFSGLRNLTAVTLSGSVNAIGLGAFMNTGLQEMMIPSEVSFWDYAVGFDNYQPLTNFIIYGYDNTTAEQYAELYGMQFVSLGDQDPTDYSVTINHVTYVVSPLQKMVSVVGVDDKTGEYEELIVESEINGYPVTEIQKEAFSELEKLKKITLPMSLQKIGANAFSGTALKACTIADDCIIEEGAFESEVLLSVAYHSPAMEYAEEQNLSYVVRKIFIEKDGVVYEYRPMEQEMIACDLADRTIENITIPSYIDGVRVTRVAYGAFYGTNLTAIYLPTDIIIESYALSNTEITEVTLGHGVTIQPYALGYYNLQQDATEYKTNDFVIRGYKASMAETYAKENDIIFEEIEGYMGDVNEDAQIDTDDATLILKYCSDILMGGSGSLTESQLVLADYNKDGVTDTDDAVEILKKYAEDILAG